MVYYIKHKNQEKYDPMISSNQLGEVSFDIFIPEQGWYKFKNKVDESDLEYLKSIEIFDDNNKTYTIEDFLSVVAKYSLC